MRHRNTGQTLSTLRCNHLFKKKYHDVNVVDNFEIVVNYPELTNSAHKNYHKSYANIIFKPTEFDLKLDIRDNKSRDKKLI